jgi:hypothetical protein
MNGMQQKTEETTPESPPKIGRPATEVEHSTAGEVSAFAHHVAQTVEDGATNLAHAVWEAGSPAEPKASISSVDGGAGEPGSSRADPTSVEPSVASEHEAKLLEGQQKLAGFGVVPPEGRPPYRGVL